MTSKMTSLVSFVKNLFPFRGYKPFVLQNEDFVRIGLNSRRVCGICPACGKRCRDVETEYKRTVRDLDMVQRKCYLTFSQKKIHCSCGYRGLEKLDFVSKSRRVTKRMETFIVSLCECMSIKEVAEIVHLDWKTVKKVDKEYVRSLLPKIEELDIRRLAIDEIAVMKGHKYLTIIRDYDTGVAVKVFFSRTYDATAEALQSLGSETLEKIRYVSLDMWDPYIKAIKEKCPDAELIFDKFHVVKKVNEALDKVRKKEFAKAEPEERKAMKKKRFVILKKQSNLSRSQKVNLVQLMHNNQRLYKAYLLKEQLLSIFDDKKSRFEQIKEQFIHWMENALSSDLEEFKDVVSTISGHFHGILNYFRYGMTNAMSEGFNTKINVIKRRTFGFHDIEYFILKIYQDSLRRLS